MKTLSLPHFFKYNFWKQLVGKPLFTLYFIDAYKIKKKTKDQKQIKLNKLTLNLMDIKYVHWTNFYFWTSLVHIKNFNYSTITFKTKPIKNKLHILNEIEFITLLKQSQNYTPKISQYIVKQNTYKIHYLQLLQLHKNYFKHLLFCLLIKYKYNMFKLLKVRFKP